MSTASWLSSLTFHPILMIKEHLRSSDVRYYKCTPYGTEQNTGIRLQISDAYYFSSTIHSDQLPNTCIF